MESKKFKKVYAKYYDLFNQGKDYKKEVDFLEKVFEKFSGREVKKILDLGCGTGLHTEELIKRCYQVIGLDISEEMIEIARKRNPSAIYLTGNISNFSLPSQNSKNEKFDAIICMFSVLGYLNENKEIENFFKCCKKHLNDGGLIILDVWNGLGVIRELPSSREKIAEIEGLRIIRKSFPILDSKNHINKIKFNVRVFNMKEKEKLIKEYNENHIVRFFFPLELKKYMEDVGLDVLKICPSFDIDSEINQEHWNMVVIGRLKDMSSQNYSERHKSFPK